MNLINVARTSLSIAVGAGTAYLTRNTGVVVRVLSVCATSLAAHLVGASRLFLKKDQAAPAASSSERKVERPEPEQVRID